MRQFRLYTDTVLVRLLNKLCLKMKLIVVITELKYQLFSSSVITYHINKYLLITYYSSITIAPLFLSRECIQSVILRFFRFTFSVSRERLHFIFPKSSKTYPLILHFNKSCLCQKYSKITRPELVQSTG